MPETFNFHDHILTIRNYKEPLKKIPTSKGFGYFGTIAGTVDGTALQCHVCGGLYDALAAHVTQKHMPVKQYREKYQIAPGTALVSERYRNNQKDKQLNALRQMTPEQKEEIKAKRMIKVRAWHQRRRELGNPQPKVTLETKNKRGACPDQLLEKIKEVKKIVGRVPSLAEFIHHTGGQRYKHLIFATFGSWKNALKMLGLEPRPHNDQKGRKKAERQSEESLLEYLKLFVEVHHKVPTSSDCTRGLIPSEDVYKRRFGSLVKARELAGIELPALKKSGHNRGYAAAVLDWMMP